MFRIFKQILTCIYICAKQRSLHIGSLLALQVLGFEIISVKDHQIRYQLIVTEFPVLEKDTGINYKVSKFFYSMQSIQSYRYPDIAVRV